MAIQNLAFPELLRYPNWGNYENGTFSAASLILDAAGEYYCNVFPAPKSGSIAKIHFGVTTVSVSGDVDVRVETITDATGLNSGTLWAANTNDVITVSSTGVNTATLTSSASVTQGQDIAVLVKADATSTPTISIGRYQETAPCVPYRIYDVGSPTKDSFGLMCIWVEYSDGTQPNIPWVRKFAAGLTSLGLIADRRYGIRFQLPFDAKISGFWNQSNYSDNATNTVEIYGADGVTVEKSATVNGNILQTTAACPAYHLFSTDFNAKARTWYRLTMRAGTLAGTPSVTYVDIPDLTETTRFSGHDFITDDENLLQPVHYTYTSSGAAPTSKDDWVNDYGRVAAMSVLISEISEFVPDTDPYYMRGGWA
jgi:hypothetical protein